MRTIKGPAIFLTQFAADQAPFDDLARAAESDTSWDEIKATIAAAGLQRTELASHLQGWLLAVHPAYDQSFEAFAAAAADDSANRRMLGIA